MTDGNILTGSDLREITNEALLVRARDVDVFAEVEPNQKERIILALKKSGNVVGFMDDGINDASVNGAGRVRQRSEPPALRANSSENESAGRVPARGWTSDDWTGGAEALEVASQVPDSTRARARRSRAAART